MFETRATTNHPDLQATYGATSSRTARWAGGLMSGAAALFLLVDAGFKVVQSPLAVETSAQLGYPAHTVFVLGILELVCLAIYLVPCTAVLGAVLWTGYLGGAIATHVRVGSPLASHTLFPLYVAALLWGGLWVRDARLRALLPLRAAN